MPKWRPIGMCADKIKAQDGYECALRSIGQCRVADMVTDPKKGSNDPAGLSLDHINAQCFGVDHRPENLITIHRQCNSIRGSRGFIAFVGGVGNALKLARLYPRVAPTILALVQGV